jgi:SAM-dependent methyltransferase
VPSPPSVVAPLESYHEIEPGYYDRVYARGRGMQAFWHRVRFEQVEAALPAQLESVLDLGCGPGTFLGRLQPPPARALGLDIAPAQIAYAEQRYGRPGLRFAADDVLSARLDERFDAVVAIEVIEHVAPNDTQPLLARILELLRPGGTVVMTTPNYRSLWPLLEVLVSLRGPVDYRAQHINPFRPERLCRELERAGFADVRCSTFFVAAPFAAVFSDRLARRLLRLEERVLPRLGAELLVRAKRPL